MADYGLIGGLASGAEGFIRGMNDAEDRRYKKMEMEAKFRAQDEDRQRQRFSDALAARSHGFLVPEGQDIYSVDPSQLKYDPQYIAMKRKMGAPYGPATPGETALDKDFAKEYSDYYASGGGSVVQKNLGLLKEAISDLNQPGELSGGPSGYLGETVQDAFNPQGAAVRDKIRTAIQSSLRQIMGPQFTEREATAMFNRAYNPHLSDNENVRRATAELNALQDMDNAKNAAGRYFEGHGTLKGFKPGLISGGLIDKGGGKQAKLDRYKQLKAKQQQSMTAGQ